MHLVYKQRKTRLADSGVEDHPFIEKLMRIGHGVGAGAIVRVVSKESDVTALISTLAATKSSNMRDVDTNSSSGSSSANASTDSSGSASANSSSSNSSASSSSSSSSSCSSSSDVRSLDNVNRANAPLDTGTMGDVPFEAPAPTAEEPETAYTFTVLILSAESAPSLPPSTVPASTGMLLTTIFCLAISLSPQLLFLLCLSLSVICPPSCTTIAELFFDHSLKFQNLVQTFSHGISRSCLRIS
jgi:hypothetical protein